MKKYFSLTKILKSGFNTEAVPAQEMLVKFFHFRKGDVSEGLAVEIDGTGRGLMSGDTAYPGTLDALVRQGRSALSAAGKTLASGQIIDLATVKKLPPLRVPEKIICVGLNYREHSAESGFKQPDYPTLFNRFNSTLIGDGAPIVRPRVSVQLDYEGELVAVIGKTGRNISVADALQHVIGYSIFNDASIRDYQFKSPQWTIGKNFDDTGPFGPCLVTADELPAGGKDLRLQTRLNGKVVQEASTNDMVFDVATLVSIISEAMTLRSGDIIVTGTPSGVGASRKPQLWMRPGDVVEVEIEKIGCLSNPIVEEAAAERRSAA